jgi:plastocyanin
MHRPSLLAVSLLIACSNGAPAADLAAAMPQDMSRPDLAGCSMNNPPSATITVRDDYYSPQSVTIPVCGKVRWVFQAGGTHGVYPWDMGFPESAIQSTGTYEYVFPNAGTFDYGCAIHGRAMPGQVIVK